MSKSNINKRLKKKSSHIGGAMTSSSDVPSTFSNVPSDVPSTIHTNPNDISDEEVKSRRAARENREDIQAAFGGY